MRKTKEVKQAERLGGGIQFNVMDLGHINKAGVDAALKGEDVDAAVKAAIDKYRLS